MKRIIFCIACKKPTPYYRSYKVRVQERIVNILGEAKEHDYEARLCKACAREAGYTVDRGKKKKND